MDDIAATQVMQRFGKAFFNRDPALLAQAITADAQWHFAFGPDSPDGRVRTGVDGFLQGTRVHCTARALPRCRHHAPRPLIGPCSRAWRGARARHHGDATRTRNLGGRAMESLRL